MTYKQEKKKDRIKKNVTKKGERKINESKRKMNK